MDEIDRDLISKLSEDGRATLKDLAKIVGLTSVGVKKRVDKLLTQKKITISALENIEKLNMRGALVFLELDSEEAREHIIERFKECPRVVYIFDTLAGYNLVILIVAENQNVLESEFMKKCSYRGGKWIRRSEIYPISGIHYTPFLKMRRNLATRKRNIAPCQINCEKCSEYQTQKCIGCPATKLYRGDL